MGKRNVCVMQERDGWKTGGDKLSSLVLTLPSQRWVSSDDIDLTRPSDAGRLDLSYSSTDYIYIHIYNVRSTNSPAYCTRTQRPHMEGRNTHGKKQVEAGHYFRSSSSKLGIDCTLPRQGVHDLTGAFWPTTRSAVAMTRRIWVLQGALKPSSLMDTWRSTTAARPTELEGLKAGFEAMLIKGSSARRTRVVSEGAFLYANRLRGERSPEGHRSSGRP
jgi:hypothetical protein